MPPASALGAFALTAFLLIVVPGPSVLFVVSRGVALGRRAALATVAGNAAGFLVLVLAVAAGLGVVVERSLVVFTALKLLGAVYLVHLGVQALRNRRHLATILDVAGTVRPRRWLLLDGFVIGIANPKAIVFFAAVLPQFVAAGGAPAAAQMTVLGLLFVAMALVCDGAWGLLAGSARVWLARSPRQLERLGGVGGLVMIALGARLAAGGRAD